MLEDVVMSKKVILELVVADKVFAIETLTQKDKDILSTLLDISLEDVIYE